MNLTKKCFRQSIGKSLLLFLYIIFCLTEAKADHQIIDSNDSSITPSQKGRRVAESLVRSDFNGSDNERTRRQETTSQFESLYKSLYDRGLYKMCSIMRNANQTQLNQSLGKDYTILAPSDEAFALIPGSQFEELKNVEQKRNEFISQHIIPSRLALSNFRAFDEKEVLNANGLVVHITAYPNGFVINGANVVDGDIPIPRSNNLVQVVDKVLYPQKAINLLEVLEENPHLTQISSFLSLSGLQKELTGNDSFTVFAPNDEAFRAVPWPVTQQMLSNNTFLRLLIANHVIPGKHYSTGLPSNKLYSIGGNLLNFTTRTVQSHSLVLVNLVPIINTDLIATNGVIHVITRIMLPKELMDDCNCLPKADQTSQNTSLSNDTLDPLLKEMLGIDPNNNIDRRYGSGPPRAQSHNGDHFTSTPKPVSFKSFWDDIFATPEEQTNTTAPTNRLTANQTTLSPERNASTLEPTKSTSNANTTDLPFIWDILTTQTPRLQNQTTDRFTNRPILSVNTTRAPETDRLRQFTPGVQYEDESNATTTSVNGTVTANTSTALPSSWTRPFYRPGSRRNLTETIANITTETTTPLTIGSSYFRPTLKPVFKPIDTRDPLTYQPNTGSNTTVPPYDRRYGIQRERTPTDRRGDRFESRSRMRTTEPIEQVKEDQYLEQEVEPQHISNRTQHPYQRDSVPPGVGLIPQRVPQIPYAPPNAQTVPHSQPIPSSQTYNRNQMRPTFDPQRNYSRFSSEDSQELEQKPYSPTSWSHQQNTTHPESRRRTPYTPEKVSEQTYTPETNRAQFNWWDSRYEPEPIAMRERPQTKGQTLPQQPGRPDQRTRPSDYPQSSQTRAQRPQTYRPGVVYVDDNQNIPPYYRPPTQEGMSRPYLRPNDTKSSSYPKTYRQSPYYRSQTPIESKRTPIPSREVYSRPEIVDRSYVPMVYNPYMRAPEMVVGEYPHMYSIDHSYDPSDQFRPPLRDPNYRDQRLDPLERRRPTKTNYDNIRRIGGKPFRRPVAEEPKPESTNQSDLKTISEIMESPDLMIAGKFKTFETLKDMVNNSGLWEALNRPTTQITIFMPTDDAFAAITDGSVEEMKKNPKLVKDFLTQHILGFSLLPQNLRNNMRVKSLNGEMHLINVIENGKILINGMEVIAATAAKNGNVYVLDNVMERSGRRSRSIIDELKKRPDLSTFSTLIQRSDFNKMISEDSGPFTLLVPNNEALNKFNLREMIKSQKDLNDFMAKHIMNGSVYSNQLTQTRDSLLSDPNKEYRRIGLSSESPVSINNSTKLISSDITTENGVIHIIDSPLTENLNISDINENLAKEDPNNKSAKQTSIDRSSQNLGIRRFTNWLNKSGLINELVRDGRQYTVVVPTDRAVGKLPLKIQSILNSEPSRLINLLEYHIIPGFIDTKTLNDNEMLTTINNKQIRFNRLDNGKVLTLSGAPINRQTNEQNLLIIAVDTVLYPPQGTVRDLITKSPLLKTFNEIVKNARMDDELRNSSEITLFAPKDEALKRIEPQILERLKTDQNYSREFVRKHIVPKVMFTTALQVNDSNNGHKEQALSGETLKIYRKPNCVSVNGIILSFADITATNGVLHIIDHII